MLHSTVARARFREVGSHPVVAEFLERIPYWNRTEIEQIDMIYIYIKKRKYLLVYYLPGDAEGSFLAEKPWTLQANNVWSNKVGVADLFLRPWFQWFSASHDVVLAVSPRRAVLAIWEDILSKTGDDEVDASESCRGTTG